MPEHHNKPTTTATTTTTPPPHPPPPSSPSSSSHSPPSSSSSPKRPSAHHHSSSSSSSASSSSAHRAAARAHVSRHLPGHRLPAHVGVRTTYVSCPRHCSRVTPIPGYFVTEAALAEVLAYDARFGCDHFKEVHTTAPCVRCHPWSSRAQAVGAMFGCRAEH